MNKLLGIFAVVVILAPVNAQDSCGAFSAVIFNIEKADTAFVVSAMDMMPDCSPSGIIYEWWTNEDGIAELRKEMLIDWRNFKPTNGYWVIKDIYSRKSKDW